jgi:hypothetical protein
VAELILCFISVRSVNAGIVLVPLPWYPAFFQLAIHAYVSCTVSASLGPIQVQVTLPEMPLGGADPGATQSMRGPFLRFLGAQEINK